MSLRLPTALLLLAGLAAPAPGAGSASVRGQSDLSGSYVLSDPERSSSDIRRAVDDATEPMLVLKALARSRLYETSEPAPRIELSFPPERIRVAQLGERPVETRDDGTPVRWRSRFGDTTTVVQTLSHGKLIQRFMGVLGSRRTDVYTLSPDGRRLSVASVITSGLLPMPIQFEVVYDRRSRPSGGDEP